MDVVFCILENNLSQNLCFTLQVRGGGDLGTNWHNEGRLMKKRNSFDDFAYCAKWLVSNNLTSSSKLCASASSAGALLLGVCANEYPGLFRAMVRCV